MSSFKCKNNIKVMEIHDDMINLSDEDFKYGHFLFKKEHGDGDQMGISVYNSDQFWIYYGLIEEGYFKDDIDVEIEIELGG